MFWDLKIDFFLSKRKKNVFFIVIPQMMSRSLQFMVDIKTLIPFESFIFLSPPMNGIYLDEYGRDKFNFLAICHVVWGPIQI